MNIAIGSLNYDIILQVERMLFEHEKLSLFISCHFWLSGGCCLCAIAWGGESLIPVKEEEIGKVFTLFSLPGLLNPHISLKRRHSLIRIHPSFCMQLAALKMRRCGRKCASSLTSTPMT